MNDVPPRLRWRCLKCGHMVHGRRMAGKWRCACNALYVVSLDGGDVKIEQVATKVAKAVVFVNGQLMMKARSA